MRCGHGPSRQDAERTGSSRHSLLCELEQRILLDAAAADTATDTAVAAEAFAEAEDAPDAQPAAPQLADDLAAAGPASERKELVFVDSSISDVESLLAEIDADAEVILLPQDRDGIEAIAEAVQSRTDIDAIHILAHGEEGLLNLGSTELTAESILGEHRDALTAIGQALSESGDILIYGRDFTAGETGLAAANLLASVTGADIAASSDPTGHEDLGGDWDLETEVGQIEAQEVEAEAWVGLVHARKLLGKRANGECRLKCITRIHEVLIGEYRHRFHYP